MTYVSYYVGLIMIKCMSMNTKLNFAMPYENYIKFYITQYLSIRMTLTLP